MNRTVGLTLRRTAGGSLLAALSFAALSSAPRQIVAVSAAAPPPQPTASVPMADTIPHPTVPTTMVVVEVAAPPIPPTPPTLPTPPTVAIATTRPPVQHATAVAIAPSRAIGPVGGAGNGFSYGYCTWWVAHRRYIPWRGNAYQWWWNARAFGYAEGQTPQPGAIMVMGISGTSPQGHVAYVESTNPNGSFVVSEMNWWGVPGGGWGRVDYRTVTTMRGILGFIY